MKKSFIIIALLAMVFSLKAQIGYQVSLLNTATGEPRANENVEVTIEITDYEGTSICKETKNATTNDFGVLSLQVGNATTFENADWSKLPFYVSATVDDILVGKSQILNVPVAEAAKTLVGSISKSDIVGTWMVEKKSIDEEEDVSSDYVCIFKEDGTYLLSMCYFNYEEEIDECAINEGYFYILGSSIQLISTNMEIRDIAWASYNKYNNKLILGKHILCGKDWGCYEYGGEILTKQN